MLKCVEICGSSCLDESQDLMGHRQNPLSVMRGALLHNCFSWALAVKYLTCLCQDTSFTCIFDILENDRQIRNDFWKIYLIFLKMTSEKRNKFWKNIWKRVVCCVITLMFFLWIFSKGLFKDVILKGRSFWLLLRHDWGKLKKVAVTNICFVQKRHTVHSGHDGCQYSYSSCIMVGFLKFLK